MSQRARLIPKDELMQTAIGWIETTLFMMKHIVLEDAAFSKEMLCLAIYSGDALLKEIARSDTD